MQKTNIVKYIFIALTVIVVCLLTLTLIVRFYKDSEGFTLLDHALEKKSLIQVKCLVALGADVNAKDSVGLTVLHWAAYSDSVKVVQWLVEQGLDINATDNDGETPLDKAIAAPFPSEDVIQWLREHGGKESEE